MGTGVGLGIGGGEGGVTGDMCTKVGFYEGCIWVAPLVGCEMFNTPFLCCKYRVYHTTQGYLG